MTRATMGLLALCVIGALGLAISGCGASALERHTMAAGLLRVTASAAKLAIETEAREALEGATTQEKVDSIMRTRRPIAAAQVAFAGVVDAHHDELLRAARESALSGEDPELDRARVIIASVLSAYREVAILAAEYGVTLPSIARVLALVGGEQ